MRELSVCFARIPAVPSRDRTAVNTIQPSVQGQVIPSAFTWPKCFPRSQLTRRSKNSKNPRKEKKKGISDFSTAKSTRIVSGVSVPPRSTCSSSPAAKKTREASRGVMGNRPVLWSPRTSSSGSRSPLLMKMIASRPCLKENADWSQSPFILARLFISDPSRLWFAFRCKLFYPTIESRAFYTSGCEYPVLDFDDVIRSRFLRDSVFRRLTSYLSDFNIY